MCGVGEIKKADGTCVCEEYKRHLSKGVCGDNCSNKEKILRNGYCEECLRYTRISSNRKECIKDNCRSDQIWDMNGYCKDCDKLSRPDTAKITCVRITCPTGQILDSNGNCVACGAYTRFGTLYETTSNFDVNGRSTGPQQGCRPDKCTDR